MGKVEEFTTLRGVYMYTKNYCKSSINKILHEEGGASKSMEPQMVYGECGVDLKEDMLSGSILNTET